MSMHKALLGGLTSLICIGCYEGHEVLPMDEGSTGMTHDESSDSGEESAEPDDSVPGMMRAELLAMLDRGDPVPEMVATARVRREILREGWSAGDSYGPGALFPIEERDRFPAAVQRILEEHTILSGTVVEAVADYEDDAERSWAIEGPMGGHAIVGPLTNELPELLGQRVQGQGFRVDDFIMPQTLKLAPATASVVDGERRVLAIMAQLSPTEPSDEWDEATIRGFIQDDEDSARRFFEVSARSMLDVSVGDVVGPYPMFETTPEEIGCDYNAWSQALNDAARAEGIEPNDFDQTMYFLPWDASDDCGWGGLAYMPGRRSWIRNHVADTVSHELGHNYGMGHGGRITCSSANPLPPTRDELDSCNPHPTADRDDVMGYHDYRRPNAPHQVNMGWVHDDEIETVTGPGEYELRPLHGDGLGTRALRYWHDALEAFVTVSYRTTQTPFDESLSSDGMGAEVHLTVPIVTDDNFGDTALVTHEGRTHMVDGATFWDRHSGLHIQQHAHDAEGVTLGVSVIPQRGAHQGDGAELVEDVTAARLTDGTEAVLSVFHEPTGQLLENPYYNEVGHQHARLVTRVTRGEPSWEALPPQALVEPPAPTNFAPRVEHHAAAAFDPARQTFVVASTRRSHESDNPDGGVIISYSLHLSEVDPQSGEVTELGDVDLGPSSSTNPFIFSDAEIDLVRTDNGFVLVMGHGGDVLNVQGKPLVLGRFSLPEAGPASLDTVEDLDLRVLPATSRAKWPTLAVGRVAGEDVVAIAWTQAYGGYPSNRIATLGYLDSDDTILAPGMDPVALADSEGLEPLLVAAPAADGGYSAFTPDLGFDAAQQRFHVSYTLSGLDGHNWEVVRRAFDLGPGYDANLGPVHHTSIHEAGWSYSAQLELNQAGVLAVAYQDDDTDFFDGRARVRIEFSMPDGKRLGGAVLVSDETEFDQLRMVASPSGDWVYVLRGGEGGVELEAVRIEP